MIPSALRALIGFIGLRWVLLCASVFMAITIPIGLFLRPITMDQLALLDAQLKQQQQQPPPPSERSAEEADGHKNGEAIEFRTMPNSGSPAPVINTCGEANSEISIRN